MRLIIPLQPKPYRYNRQPFFVPRIEIARAKLRRRPKFNDDVIDFLGVRKVYNSEYKPWFKFLWLLISLLCIFLCILQIGNRVYDFINFPVIFGVKMERQTTFTFPSITLCSGYFINKIVQDHQYHNENEKFGNFEIFNVTNFWRDGEYVILENEIFLGKPCPLFSGDAEECSSRNATDDMDVDWIDTFWGRCITLSLKNKIFEYRGPFTWISIIWKFSDCAEDTETENVVLYFIIHREGLRLVHDIPFLSQSIHVGYASKARISAREFELMDTWIKPCLSEGEVVECHNDCVDKLMASKLNCSLPFTNISDKRVCEHHDEFFDAYKAADEVYNELGTGDCLHCHQPCKEIVYTITMEGEKKNIKEETIFDQLGNEKVKKKCAVTEIKLLYADESREILYEKSSYSMSSLLSEIGGSMGFYLGISILSLIEMVESLSRYLIFVVTK